VIPLGNDTILNPYCTIIAPLGSRPGFNEASQQLPSVLHVHQRKASSLGCSSEVALVVLWF
jgi:hypothetical protein